MDLVARGFQRLIRRSLQRGLRGVWIRGQPPVGPAIYAANHHGWWDGYLAGFWLWSAGLQPGLLMRAEQLQRFPLFRRLGAIGSGELRGALELLRSRPLIIFPEGRILPAGPLGALAPGATWLAKQASVPLIPLAIRTALRGHEFPEAYLRLGEPCSGRQLPSQLAHLVSQTDLLAQVSDPERPLPGFSLLLRGRSSSSERLGAANRALEILLERGA
jgi:1-acyl-sn-glycerol-3-phosphate acyltransferase